MWASGNVNYSFVIVKTLKKVVTKHYSGSSCIMRGKIFILQSHLVSIIFHDLFISKKFPLDTPLKTQTLEKSNTGEL